MKKILSTYILLNFILINQCHALNETEIDYTRIMSELDYEKIIPRNINSTEIIGINEIFYSISAVCVVLFIIAMCIVFVTLLLIYYIYDNSKKKIITSTMGIHAQV